MKETKYEVVDVEREGGNEAHLTNDTVRSLTWDIQRVDLGRRLFAEARTQPLIANINGAAMAGIIIPRESSAKQLISPR